MGQWLGRWRRRGWGWRRRGSGHDGCPVRASATARRDDRERDESRPCPVHGDGSVLSHSTGRAGQAERTTHRSHWERLHADRQRELRPVSRVDAGDRRAEARVDSGALRCARPRTSGHVPRLSRALRSAIRVGSQPSEAGGAVPGTSEPPGMGKPDVHVFKIPGIPGSQTQVVTSRDRRDLGIERRLRPSQPVASAHDFAPDCGGLVVEGKDAPSNRWARSRVIGGRFGINGTSGMDRLPA